MVNKINLEDERKWYTSSLIGWALIVFMIVFGYYIINTYFHKDYSSFAKCLSETGFVMYGRDSCSYCQEVKKMFGESFKYINYVDCETTPDVCMDVGVMAVPAWTFNNTMYIGINLSHFSELSGCQQG